MENGSWASKREAGEPGGDFCNIVLVDADGWDTVMTAMKVVRKLGQEVLMSLG